MTVRDALMDPDSLVAGHWDGPAMPVGMVDLAHMPVDIGPIRLPPWPVIGLGDSAHPVADALDAVVEAPVDAEALFASIHANPVAAAVTVQTLRALEGMALDDAFVVESLAYGVLQGGAEHGRWLDARRAGAELPEGAVRMTRAGGTLAIHMDRAAAHNAVDRSMRDALREAFLVAALDPELEQVRLTGAGRAFCIGADLGEFGTTRDPAAAHAIRMATLPAHVIARVGAKLTAHVKGACVGAGLEMAAFAARVTAGADAWFQLPELAMGLLPGAGGCVSVSRRIGLQRTTLLILSGKRINARTALGWGLVDAIMDGDAADEGQAEILG